MNKVYVLFSGSIHEGGGIHEVYGDKDKAIKFALMEVAEVNKRNSRIHKHNSAPFLFKDVTEECEKYGNTMVIKMWSSTIEHITIYEYEVK